MKNKVTEINNIINRERVLRVPEGDSFTLNTFITREEITQLRVLIHARQQDLANMIEDDIVDEKDAMREVYDLSWIYSLILAGLRKEK